MKTILYFGFYDPNYARNRVLIKGLRASDVIVHECRIKPGRFGLLKLALKYLINHQKYDVMIVGFPGQEAMFLAKLLTRKKIIFDAFTSHYGGYILDRKRFSPNSWRAWWFRFLDKYSCRLADKVLLDTNAHIDFFVREFNLPEEKFVRLWIGTDPEQFVKCPIKTPSQNFTAVFWGTFIPLQGVSYIVRAAELLAEKDINFVLIGKGQEKPAIMRMAQNLPNVKFLDMMESDQLQSVICEADICLGIFGDTPKTPLVIPNKVYEAVAMAKPVITADTSAIRELFGDQDMLLVPTADARALADAIIKLKDDKELSSSLAQHGYQTFMDKATPEVIVTGLIKYL